MPVSVQADCAHKMIPKRPDDDRLRLTPKLLANRFKRGRKVILRRGGERERRIQQRFAPKFDVG
jgi:hypothetical protein